MTFRGRLLIAFLSAAALPVTLLAVGVRRQLTARVLDQHRQSVLSQSRLARDDLARESALIAGRLAALARSLASDDRFRLAVRGAATERGYLLDYAGAAMRVSGLTMLQIQDEEGRILSSGHFRNEFDRLEKELPRLVASARGPVLVSARAPEGPFLALVRTDSVRIADRRFDLTGGVSVDSAFLRRFEREAGGTATLVAADSIAGPSPNEQVVVADLIVPSIGAERARLDSARLLIAQPLSGLRELQRDIDRWFVASLALVVALAAALAAWLASRLSAPIARLAEASERVELHRGAISEAAVGRGRADEIGALARTLDSMAGRLRSGALKLRDAERRATVGDMARQVNHDIKNGLIPIRNVLRHLAEVAERSPDNLPPIFAERRGTMESSVAYLETLAQRYARLAPVAEPRLVDANALVRDTAAIAGTDGAAVETHLDPAAPSVNADPIILRRILENLIRNGIESLDERAGRVIVRTSRAPTGALRVLVSDNGRGMSDDELARAFDDFFTTKPRGSGLGLSVVRRLTVDLGGSLHVESQPGRGTTFTIEIPAATSRSMS